MSAHPQAETGHEHGDHPKFLHHHFDTPLQQFESDKFGMWLFLATEVLLFGGLFCAYAVYRANHPEIFVYAHQFLDKTLGATNTVVLLVSSWTMAMAVRAAQMSNKKALIGFLFATMICAFGFMGIKFVEYKAKIEHGLLWGARYSHTAEGHGAEGHAAEGAAAHEAAPAAAATGGHEAVAAGHETAGTAPAESSAMASAPAAGEAPAAPADAAAAAAVPVPGAPVVPEVSKIAIAPPPPSGLAPRASAELGGHVSPESVPNNVQSFFAVYFAMTGLHGIHVLVGIIVIGIMMFLSAKGNFDAEYFTPIELTGLYWHIVDLIWIFLFPLLYLIH